jgi:hypothetical protein
MPREEPFLEVLEEILEGELEGELRWVRRELRHHPPRLTTIKVRFSKGPIMKIGPITLVAVGATATASIVGFDQFGQPFLGPMPVPTLSSDDTAGAIATLDPSTGKVTAVANGVANITGSLTIAEGLSLTDTETVTVAIPVTPPPPQVLSSIKVAFA